jgi:hypothetical protein
MPEFKAKIDELAEGLMERIETQNVIGKTLTLIIKTYKFKVTQK